jgi:hypothetical protein
LLGDLADQHEVIDVVAAQQVLELGRVEDRVARLDQERHSVAMA